MDTISRNNNTVTSFVEALFTEGDLGAITAGGTEQGRASVCPHRAHCQPARDQHLAVRDGRIVERWGRLDDLGLIRQLGLVPALTGQVDKAWMSQPRYCNAMPVS